MNGLGDIICTGSAVICNDAQTAVQQMDTVFQGLPQNLQNQFQASHDAIMAQFNTNWAAWQASYLPILNSICCTLDSIGVQATTLANQMLAANGKAGLPGAGQTSGDVWSNIATIAMVGLVAFFIYESRKK